jgi:phosphotransferase system  glucose/maltose/N-acetylglucosamine-specific IIC component
MHCDITETSLFLCRFIAKILANYSVNIATCVITSVTIAYFYALKTLKMCDAFIQHCFQLIIIVVVVIIIILNTNIEIESSKQSPNLMCISLVK